MRTLFVACAVTVSCAPPVEPPPSPAPRLSAIAPPAPQASSSAPSPEPSSSAALEPPAPFEARIVALRIEGRDAGVLAPPLRKALSSIAACAKKAAWIDATFIDGDTGVPSSLEVTSDDDAGAAACVRPILAALKLEPRKPKAVKINVTFRVGPPPDETALPPIASTDTFVRLPGAACGGIHQEACAPHKDCMAPTKYPAKCPVELGLPPPLEVAAATKSVTISIGGGKPGQGGESVAFAAGADRCSLTKEMTSGERFAPASETVDVPCADVERVWSLARRSFAGKRPQSSPIPDSVTVTIEFRGGSSTEMVQWSNNAKLDEELAKVAKVIAPITAAWGELRLARLGP